MPHTPTPITGTQVARVRTHSKRSGLPPVPSGVARDLAIFLEAIGEQLEVRDAQRGSPLDASPTFRDLIESGVVSANGISVSGREYTLDQIRSLLSSTTPSWVTSELAPPPASGVVVTLQETSVKVTWDDIALTFANYGHTEVWRSTTNNISTAEKYAWSDAKEMFDVLPPANTLFYYWVRHVSRSGIVGGFQGTSGVSWVAGMPSAVTVQPAPASRVIDGDILLNWSEPASNVDIKYYVVYALDAQNDPILPALGRSNTTWFYYTPPTTGAYRFGVLAIPMAGDEPVTPLAEQFVPFTITVGVFSAPTALAHQIINNKVELTWGSPLNVGDGTTLRLSSFEIWHTAVGGAGTLVQSVGGLTTRFRVPVDFTGARTYYVVAVDSAGARGAAASIEVTITGVSAPPGFAVAISGEDLVLSWGTPTSQLPLAEYEVQYGSPGFAWGAGTALPRVSANSIRLRPTWNGARDFRIKAFDINGNASADASASFTIAAPGTPTGFRTDVVDNNVLLFWTPATQTASQLPVVSFEVRKGNTSSTWETATSVGTKQGTFTTIFEAAAGTYRYHIAAKDSAGQYGASTSTVATVAEPPDYILNASLDELMNGTVWSFDDNTVQGWSGTNTVVTAGDSVLKLAAATTNDPQLILASPPAPAGRQYLYGCEWPVLQMKVRRVAGTGSGAVLTYARTDADGGNARSYDPVNFYKDADVALPAIADGWKTLTFDLSALTVGGTDWMVSRITGIRIDLGNTIGDAFEVDWIRALPFKTSNMVWDGLENGVYGPFADTLTVDQHFAQGPWATPQDKINAGYDFPLEPSATTGYIEKVIDYGTTLPGIKITNLSVFNVLDGAVTQTPTVSVSNTSAVAGYTDNAGLSTVFAVSFRWVKIRWDFASAGGDDSMGVSSMNTKTDAKIKNDMGTGTANSGDAGGTTVNFNTAFTDVQAITVTPAGTAARYAVYDFVDAPNPTSFKVLLFDNTGARVSGDFSWAARGY